VNKNFTIPMFEIDKKILEYKISLTLSVYFPRDIDPSQYIDDELQKLQQSIKLLEKLAKQKDRSTRAVAKSMEQDPLILDVIRLILDLPTKIEFRDGRKIPTGRTLEVKDTLQIAQLIDEVGFWELISTTKGEIEDLTKIALIHSKSAKRKFQAISNFEMEIDEAITNVLSELEKQTGLVLEKDSSRNSGLTFKTRRSVDYVIKYNQKPVAAIDVLVTTNPGGSQVFDLRSNYPNLQNELNSIPMKLIVIADGPGMNRIPENALRELFAAVPSVFSIRQVKTGMLANALIEATTEEQTRIEPVDRIIESVLFSGGDVTVDDLPPTNTDSRLTLAQYVTANPHLDLELSMRGKSLKWSRANIVRSGLNLLDSYQPKKALGLFARLLDGHLGQTKIVNNNLYARLEVNGTSVLSAKTLVVATDKEVDDQTYREVARESLQTIPEAKIVFFIVADKQKTKSLPTKGLQSTLPANVIALDVADIIRMAQSKLTPIDHLVSIIFEQSDLTKISPFVINNATPKRIYYGREKEEATLLATLASNSVALLGSRKIGKTSLLRNVKESLEDAEFTPYFLDCQTINNWLAFGEMAHRNWDVELPDNFEPHHLFDMVSTLKKRNGKSIIFLLDEIDQLLTWDMTHGREQVSEPFFRTCRTISQSGEAQFVFSGERTIAEKMWDPHSPHWNFCKKLLLRQLEKQAAQELMIKPLLSLQVQVQNLEEFAEKVWKVSSGHPQIIQFLGDRLVGELNQRPATSRNIVTPTDIDEIANSLEFQEQYVRTYWGQATDLEKLIGLLVIAGLNNPSMILEEFQNNKINVDEDQIIDALRILELYGIIDPDKNKYRLRATWFTDALTGYGELTSTIRGYWRKMK
jgi:hypothetical protein